MTVNGVNELKEPAVSINFQTLNDVLIAFGTLAGVVVLFVIAMTTAAVVAERDKRNARRGRHIAATSALAPHATQSDDRELVLR